MKGVLKILSIFIFLFLNSNLLDSQIKQFQTENIRLVYLSPSYSYMVPHIASCYENSLAFHKYLWGYTPSEEVTVLLNDFSDTGNGGTLVIPWNMLIIGISPFSHTYNIVPSNERFQWLMNHELAHIVMCDKASKRDKFFRSVFGSKVSVDNTNPTSMIYSYLTTPRWYSPRWYHEGIAVFLETWMSGGLGRVLGGYDEMVFRTMVRDSSYFYNVVGLESEGTTIDFQVGVNSYLYGTRFVSYLAYNYGVDKLIDFYSRTDNSKRFYATQFKNIYGSDVEDEWNKWIEFEKKFQRKNLDRIRLFPITPIRDVIDISLGSVSKSFYNEKTGKIYAAVNYPGKMAHITEIDLHSGSMRTIAQVPSPVLYYVSSLEYDESTETLFLSTNNSDWRGIRSIDVKTGKHKDLIENTRSGSFAFNKSDKSLWAIQHFSGRVSLVRLQKPYKSLDEIYTIPFGNSLFDIDISNDGKFLSAIMADVKGDHKLVLFSTKELINGNSDYTEIYKFEDSPMSGFRFSNDDKSLIGSSYYTGVSNIYRINIESKEFELLSNAETGFFNPVEVSNDSILVFDFHQDGLTPVLIGINPIEDANAISLFGQQVFKKNPVVKDWMIPPPSKINIDSLKTFEGDYNSFNELRFATAYPVVEGYKNTLAWGYRFNFLDPLGLHSLKVTTSITPYSFIKKNERIHLNLNYSYWSWTVSASYNKTNFYDLFGPSKISRAGTAITVKYKKSIVNKRPVKFDLFVKAGAYGKLDKLPEYQNVEAPFSELYTGLANIHYSYLRKSLGAVDYEQGFNWDFYIHTYLADSEFYPRVISNQDVGFLLPFRNSSFWLRTSVGQAFGDQNNSLSGFYFGGFINNYIDYQQVLRFREYSSFPGVEINELGSKNYGKVTSELNLTPIRFKKVGFHRFYTTHARLTLFGMGLYTDFDSMNSRMVFNTGAQLDFDLVLFSLFKSTFSIGYAKAFLPGNANSDQFMISLKI